jgi:hypothetical protein
MIASTGHGWAVAIFPLVAAGIAFAFAAVLARRVADRWRPHEAVWAVALLMYGVASGAMFVGVLTGWTPFVYQVYWLLGAVLNVPYLFGGELYVLDRKRTVAHVFLVVLVGLSVLAALVVLGASVNEGALEQTLPLGKEVFGDGSLPYRLAQYYSLPAYFLLLGGLVWSALQMKGVPAARDRAAGVFGIAVGATIVAIGSGIGAAFHVVPVFSTALAAGVAVMFWGFRRASRPVPTPPAPAAI